MRARDFLLEYNRDKTAQVFGNKLLAAFLQDPSLARTDQTLSKYKLFFDQKDKISQDPSYLKTELSKWTPDILNRIFLVLEKSDPTPNKEYVQWLAKCYANEQVKLEDIYSKGEDWLKTYHQMKLARLFKGNWANDGNIMNLKFANLPDIALNNELLGLLQTKEEQTVDKGTSSVLLDTEQVRIIVPKDETAAKYYGQGTRWCTAAKNNNMFNQYNKSGPLLILLPKQPTYGGEKYQVHFLSDQFMDENDNDVDMFDLLQNRFGNLVPFFKEFEPTLSDYLVFADPQILAPLLEKIKDLAVERLNEIEQTWEDNNMEYYLDELEEGGYIDENGDIDWGKAPSYLDINTEAKYLYNDLLDGITVNARDIPNLCSEYQYENPGDYLQVHNLDRLVSWKVSHNYSTRDNSHTHARLGEWVYENLEVYQLGDEAYEVRKLEK